MNSNITIHVLARRFADHANTAENAGARLSKHADFPSYVAQASAPKVGKASPVVAAAKALLSVTDERGTKTGPKGAQVWTKYSDGVTGQHVENVAALLKAAIVRDEPTPLRLAATFSGPKGTDGTGTVEIPQDSELGKQIMALIVASKATA